MRRSQQAFSAPSKQTQSSNAKAELSSTASINASSTTLIPSSELLASKPRDSTLKREQNSCYEHDNGLIRSIAAASSVTFFIIASFGRNGSYSIPDAMQKRPRQDRRGKGSEVLTARFRRQRRDGGLFLSTRQLVHDAGCVPP